MDKEVVVSVNNEILSYKKERWMNLEGIILSETSEMEKDRSLYDFAHMWNLKKILIREQSQYFP